MTWKSSPRETAGTILLFLCWLMLAGAARAQQSAIEVRSPSTKLLQTAPGRVVTASVVVANRGSGPQDVTERLVLPAGCQKVAPPDIPISLAPGGQTVRVLAVAVPSTMPAGNFTIEYHVQGRQDPSARDSVAIQVGVTPVDDLQLIVEPRPDFVIVGEAYPVKLSVVNKGNSRLAVKLQSRSSLNFPVEASPSVFVVEAGATREIACTIRTDANFSQHTRHAVTFDVSALTTGGKTLTASQASVVELIPRIGGSRDVEHRLPVQLRWMAMTESGYGAHVQAEIAGSGSLDEAGEHHVDFVLRGPDIEQTNLFGEREEYGATYRGRHWQFDFGDRDYQLSPLTERHGFGRGAGISWREERTAAGAFYMRSRFRREQTEEMGAYLQRQITPVLQVQGNFLRKFGEVSDADRAWPQSLFTVESHYHPGKMLDLQLEAGMSHGDNGTDDFAYRIDARGQLPSKLSYAVEHVHAGPDFRGYYSNTDTTYLSINKEFSRRLRAYASVNRYAGNLALSDVRATVVNRENSWTAGMEYVPAKDTTLHLEWQHVKRADILLPAAYDFSSDAVRVGAGHNFGKLQLQSFLDLGTLDNSITGENGFFQRYSVTAQWQPNARHTYSVHAAYGPDAFSGSTDNSFSAGVSWRWRLREDLEANVSYARNQFDGVTGNQQDQVMGSLNYHLDGGRELSVIGRWSRSDSKRAGSTVLNDSGVMVTYSIPLGVPVGRKRSIGSLEGRVVNASRGTGVSRVVLQVGEQYAVTDENGIFEFPSLKPGAWELRVLADSLGSRMAMTTPLPKKIRILPAETTHVDLTASPACSVVVRVTRYDFADGRALNGSGVLREAGGQEGVAVELGNGRDIWRAQTDRTGAASFDRLPPGAWTLRVAGSDLPALHVLEDPSQTLNLREGEAREAAIRLLPQRRTLRMLDQGKIR